MGVGPGDTSKEQIALPAGRGCKQGWGLKLWWGCKPCGTYAPGHTGDPGIRGDPIPTITLGTRSHESGLVESGDI